MSNWPYTLGYKDETVCLVVSLSYPIGQISDQLGVFARSLFKGARPLSRTNTKSGRHNRFMISVWLVRIKGDCNATKNNCACKAIQRKAIFVSRWDFIVLMNVSAGARDAVQSVNRH